MSEFYTTKIDDSLRKAYFEMFGDYDYGIPHLPNGIDHDSSFLEDAIKACIDYKKPMSKRLHEYYPEEYKEYKKLLDEGCLI